MLWVGLFKVYVLVKLKQFFQCFTVLVNAALTETLYTHTDSNSLTWHILTRRTDFTFIMHVHLI